MSSDRTDALSKPLPKRREKQDLKVEAFVRNVVVERIPARIFEAREKVMSLIKKRKLNGATANLSGLPIADNHGYRAFKYRI